VTDRDAGESAVVIERRGGGFGVFLAGLAVGAGLALLLAPQLGEETRADLARGARRVKRKARRFAATTGDAARDMMDSTGDAARRAVSETREAIERRLARHHSLDADASAYDGEDDGV